MKEHEQNNIKKDYSIDKSPRSAKILSAFFIVGLLFLIKVSINSDFAVNNQNPAKSQPKTFNQAKFNEKTRLNHKTGSTYDEIKNSAHDTVNLELNPLESYNGKTKREMYDIRKSYVEKSLFYSPNYEPNEEIFGNIEDGKSWWGLEPMVCSHGDEDTTRGLSALSRFINNPDLLVQTYFPFNMTYYEGIKEYCNSKFARLIPSSLTYEPKSNTITAKYFMTPYVFNNRLNYFGMKDIYYPFILSGLNARDFGFEYMYINNLYNAKMLNEDNAAKHVYQFRDYIHVGASCRRPEGCNNLSPRQTELEFIITSLPAELDIKLWKKQPMLKDLKEDIKFKVMFIEE